ncbi:MAG: DUF4276 family protein [Cytophagaceae bacterium]|nr:MAG: DUF4276 family protein [Cytophagaceae bacterium]
MIKVAAIVEGYGDFHSVPSLIAKIGVALGVPAIAPNPIRSGEWKKLRRPGDLEKSLDIAASRNPDLILILLDLEDDCVVSELQSHQKRITEWLSGRSIRIEFAFIVREYESIFLSAPSCLGEIDLAKLPHEPESERDAKGHIKRVTGRRYKETQDQERLTKALDVSEAYRGSRSFRRLCKAVTGLSYASIELLM